MAATFTLTTSYFPLNEQGESFSGTSAPVGVIWISNFTIESFLAATIYLVPFADLSTINLTLAHSLYKI